MAEREAAAETEAKAAGIFEAALGFAAPDPLPDRPVLVASFKEIDRWSHEGILRSIHRMPASSPRFPSVPLRSLGEVKYGLQKSPGNRPTSHPRPYLRVANAQRRRLDLGSIKSIDVPDEDMPRYRLASGDILLCEGNSPDLVGRGAIWHNEIPDCVHQNHVIRVRLDLEQALPEFVLAVINSSYGQAYFRSQAKRTTNLASINSTEVASLPLPLPTITEQQAMAAGLLESREEARQRLEAARRIREPGWAAFEASVYRSNQPARRWQHHCRTLGVQIRTAKWPRRP